MVSSTEFEKPRQAEMHRIQVGSVGWIAVAALLLAAWAGGIYLAPYTSGRINMYVVQPLLWLLPALLALRLLGARLQAARDTRGYALPAFLVGVVQIGALLGAGLLFGFGLSPFGHSPLALVMNFWYIGALLVATEICRWFILRSLLERGETLAVAVTWAILFLVALPFAGLSRLTSLETAFPYLGSVVLPAAAAGLLATYLALLGGPLASIAYLGTVKVFMWYAPILPDLSWPVTAMVGVLVPLIGLALIPASEEETAEDAAEVGGLGPGWLIGAAILVAVVWFNLGVFGVKPDIVHGGSMEPTYQTGDVVVTREVPADELEVGDVIRFTAGSRVILHRLIEIDLSDGELVFIAQGDNNPAPDRPIGAEDISGKVVAHLPKAGLPVVYLQRLVGAAMSVIG